MRTAIVGSILIVALVGGCRTMARMSVDQTLDRFHAAASRADEKSYFECFAPEGVFLGTDASERWNVVEFRAFANPYFSQGKGWTYTASDRHIEFSPSRNVAWFDELLENEKLGTCRGSGVLRLIGDRWKIAQYNLSIPIPNDQARQVAEMIRAAASTQNTK